MKYEFSGCFRVIEKRVIVSVSGSCGLYFSLGVRFLTAPTCVCPCAGSSYPEAQHREVSVFAGVSAYKVPYYLTMVQNGTVMGAQPQLSEMLF